MDLDDLRSILRNLSVDIWTFLDTVIIVASLDYGNEFESRKERIIERLNAPVVSSSSNSDLNLQRVKVNAIEKEENYSRAETCIEKDSDSHQEVESPFIDAQQIEILAIKENLQDSNQSNESLIDLLQYLTEMDIRVEVLEETVIAKQVSRLRNHSSIEVQRLAKNLIGKWKDLASEWWKSNNISLFASSFYLVNMGLEELISKSTLDEEPLVVATSNEDSPQHIPPESTPNGSHQVPKSTCSTNAKIQRETNVDLDHGISIPRDEYFWRNYGQKPIKRSPFPKVYYKCISLRGCPARKHVERDVEDPMTLIITYEGEHNHSHQPLLPKKDSKGGSSGSNTVDLQSEPWGDVMPQREVQPKSTQPAPSKVIYRKREKKRRKTKHIVYPESIASATLKLDDSYQEVKGQRTIEAKDLNNIQKPTNMFIENGGSFQIFKRSEAHDTHVIRLCAINWSMAERPPTS